MSRPPRATPSRLAGRTALITGAGNGLGRAIARHLARCGCRTILVGRDGAKLAAVAAEIGADARIALGDVAEEQSVAELAGQLTDEDISILINNAGVGGPVAELTAISVDQWDEVFAVNVRGTFLMCRALLPAMIARGGGDVINIASVTGKRPLMRRTPYAASKMAIIGLTTTLAHEVGPLGVMVNSLSPGPVAGPRMAYNYAREAAATGRTAAAAEEAYVARSALHRMITEDEVAAAVEAMLGMPGLCAADIDLSAGMVGR
jgi:NAD(P)-dependent dehydrogenase (short-subunit alcohol dehydrogenase family)